MKKLLTLCLLAVTMCAMAQEQTIKRVAIPEIVDKTREVPTTIKQMLRTSLTSTVVRTPGYECVDMSNNLLYGYQMPKRASYRLVAEVSPFMDDKIMVGVKLVDTETAQLINAVPTIMVSTKNQTKLAKTFAQMGKKLLSSQK